MTDGGETIITGPIRARKLAEAMCGRLPFAALTVEERRVAHALLAATRKPSDPDVPVPVLEPSDATIVVLHPDGQVEAVDFKGGVEASDDDALETHYEEYPEDRPSLAQVAAAYARQQRLDVTTEQIEAAADVLADVTDDPRIIVGYALAGRPRRGEQVTSGSEDERDIRDVVLSIDHAIGYYSKPRASIVGVTVRTWERWVAGASRPNPRNERGASKEALQQCHTQQGQSRPDPDASYCAHTSVALGVSL